MTRPFVQAVVAKARNGVIGASGRLPWHLPSDLRHFKIKTMGTPMIMGRKTFESLPRLLPDRRHIVLTTNQAWWAEGVEIAHSTQEALDLAKSETVSVIGGADIFRLFLPITDLIHLTEVDLQPEGDTFFPALNDREWMITRAAMEPAREPYPAHRFVTMRRRAPLSSD